MHVKINIFLCVLFFSQTAFAICPLESIEVEYASPVSNLKKRTCGYFKDDLFIKHGPETEYGEDNNIKKVIQYNRGVQVQDLANTVKTPGSDLYSKSDEDESFILINEILKVLSFDKQSLNEGLFKVGGCDTNPKEWLIAAFTKKDVKKNYAFSDKCDVIGSFVASFSKFFPTNFKLRNLKSFTETSMNVKMELKKNGLSEIRYRFEAEEGFLKSPEKTILFKAYYEITINPITGAAHPDTQDGKITLIKVGDRILNIERPILLNK